MRRWEGSASRRTITLLLGALVVVGGAQPAMAFPDAADQVRAADHEVDPNIITRFAGADRIETGLEVSSTWDDGMATGVVLARSDGFADALAGAPLAVAKGGPLLLTTPDTLDPRVLAEIIRLLPAGGSVYLLGGTGALSAAVETAITGAGFVAVRYAGATRFDTAIAIADSGLGNPSPLLLTNGLDFPDALPAGAAAGAVGGAVLLTSGTTVPGSLQAHLDAHPAATLFAIGGPAAAAVPGATAVTGPTRYDTAVAVAEEFFAAPFAVGVVSGTNYPDALTGGADVAIAGAPLLLTPGDLLHPSARAYLEANHDSIDIGVVYGGTAAVSETAALQVLGAIS